MHKQINYNIEARTKLKAGVDKLANTVKVTLGARGRNVILDQPNGDPVITKDGVTVAKHIFLEDPVENMGALVVKQVSSKTNDEAGDGTTTATVLAQSIIDEGLKNVTAGANPIELKRGIDKATDVVTKYLKSISKEITTTEEIAQIGTISANNDSTIGELIASAMDKVGKDGVISVEEASGRQTYLDVVEGLQIDRGYVSPHFVTNQENMSVEMKDAYVLIYDGRISSIRDVSSIMEKVANSSSEVVLIAEDVEGEALQMLVINKLRGALKCVAVKAPSFGDRRREILEDIAVLTGGEVISSEKGIKLEDATLEHLGVAKKLIVEKDATTIVGGGGSQEAIDQRIALIRNQLDKEESNFGREKLQERLAKLTGGVAVLHIGATSEVEMKEKKDRVEDALNATRAGVQEGMVVGGGVALLRASMVLDNVEGLDNKDQEIGVQIVKKALESPIKAIVSNAGGEGSIVAKTILENEDLNIGFDVRNSAYVNMFEKGIVDPTKVTRTALQSASSVAGLLLTTEAVVYEEKSDDGNNDIPPMGY